MIYCVILARAGSKGLPGKNVAPLAGRAMIEHTIDHAMASRRVGRVAVSSDDPLALSIAARRGLETVERPAELAGDTATVDAAARHAVLALERRHAERCDAAVILYANVPLRPGDLIDRALAKLRDTGCDSVQSVCPVGKMHPWWMRRLTGPGSDVLDKYEPNEVYRRQDLPPVYMLDGGIIAVTRRSLMLVADGRPHAFLGSDCRAIVTRDGEVVDVDTATDLHTASAMLEARAGASPGSRIAIAGRAVAPGEPAFVIAELGVNHDGDADRAVAMVRDAADAGADAVKVQVFDSRMLLSAEAELAAYQRGGERDVHAMLHRLQLDAAQLARVRAAARDAGLAFIATAFSPALAPLTRDLDVDAVKLASPDAVNTPLIDAMIGLGKPLIASTGTCTLEEIASLVERCGRHPLALLHCVSAYPTPAGQANLRRIGAIAARFRRPTGYSDHTTDPITGALAVAQGACVIEKHLTYDRRATGPDHAASFEPAQLAAYIASIRAAEAMLAADPMQVMDAEREVKRVSRQSVCLTRDLPAGHTLTRGDLTVKRPGTGVPAARLDGCVGRTLARAVRANHLLHDADLADGAGDNLATEAA